MRTRARVDIYSEDQLKKMNATSRHIGAVGNFAIVPRIVMTIAREGDVILDFGAGKNAIQARKLQDDGLDVIAYDVGNNFNPIYHFKDALNYRYSIVYASNVLNVQHTDAQIYDTLSLLHEIVVNDGKVVVNYPPSPRHAHTPFGDSVTTEMVDEIIRGLFRNVKRVRGYSSPVWIAEK